MLKKIITIISVLYLNTLLFASHTFAVAAPKLNCIGLPGCVDTIKESPTAPAIEKKIALEWIGNVIGEAIQYVAVIAVISLMLAGIFYIFSGGEEEKTKKAKTWIIWSLAGVLIAISAWGIIEVINKIQIS